MLINERSINLDDFWQLYAFKVAGAWCHGGALPTFTNLLSILWCNNPFSWFLHRLNIYLSLSSLDYKVSAPQCRANIEELFMWTKLSSHENKYFNSVTWIFFNTWTIFYIFKRAGSIILSTHWLSIE